MSLKFLSKALPTSENSLAYTHLISFPLGKNKGIRKWIPNFFDFKINAIAVMVLSTFDLILATTRLCLYTLAIIPIFTTKKPIFKDFFFSIATLVKAALAFIHGQKEGLLPFSEYELGAMKVLRDNTFLLDMPLTANDHDKAVLRPLVNNLGIERCLNELYNNDKMELLDDVISTCNAQMLFLSLILNRYSQGILIRDRERIFQHFSCEPDGRDFVINVFNDPTITNEMKANLNRLCYIQTDNRNADAAFRQVVTELKDAIIRDAAIANAATKHAVEARENLQHEIQNEDLTDAELIELPQGAELRNILLQQNAIQMAYNKKLSALIAIIKLRPPLILELSDELYEKDSLRFGAILNDVIRVEGIKNALIKSLDNNNYELVKKIVKACHAKSELYEIISNFYYISYERRTLLFQIFGCDHNTFVTAMLADQEVSEKIKNNIPKMCEIQLNNVGGMEAQKRVIADLTNSVIEHYRPLQTAQETTREVLSKLNAKKAESGLDADDDFPDEVSPEIDALQKEYQRLSSQENKLRMMYNQKLRGLVSVLNRSPAFYMNLPQEILETATPNPNYAQIKNIFDNDPKLFQDLLKKIPAALAGSVDPVTRESFVMYLLSIKRYDIALTLLKLDSEQLDRITVFNLLKSGTTYFSTSGSVITQIDIEEMLSTNHEEIVALYKAYGESSAKDIDAQPTQNDKLIRIAVNLGIRGGSIRINGAGAFLDTLLSNRIIKMVHKANAIKEEVLLDIPHIDIIRDATALANAVGANTAGVRQCLNEILNAKELEIKAKHIIAHLQAQLLAEGDKAKETIKGILNYLESEGNQGCITRKQNVLPAVWNSIRGVKFVDSEKKDMDKLRDYLSSFKDKIALQILPEWVHERSRWSMTLYKERGVVSTKSGERDYADNSVLQHAPQAIEQFDFRYRPHDLVTFLRVGINDDRNKLRKGVSDTVQEFFKSLPDDMQTQIDPLITDRNGQYTDFALFCVLIHMNFIEFERGSESPSH